MNDRFPRLVLDLILTLVVFVLLAVVGALIWHQAAHLPTYTRTAQGAEMDQLRLAELFPVEGWFAVVGAVLGLVGGLGLLLWRKAEPVWIVVSGVVASFVAAWLMASVGRLIGPSEPGSVLRHAAVGTKAPVQLSLADHHFVWSVHGHQLANFHAAPVALAWPLGAVLGMLLVLMFSSGTNGSGRAPSPEATAAPESP